MIKSKRIYLRRFTIDEADLLFQLDGDADVMKYITLGIPRTMDEVIEKSMPRILKSYQDKTDFGIFAAYLINSSGGSFPPEAFLNITGIAVLISFSQYFIREMLSSFINTPIPNLHCINAWRWFRNILKRFEYFYSISLFIYQSKLFHYCFYRLLISSFIW